MRKRRQYSPTGSYHIVIRGVNKQNIFFDDDDRNHFLKLIAKYKEKYNIKLQVYTLMDNHVHLSPDDKNKNISKFMQTVESVYARYFNKKYDRIGPLFQGRFASEIITDDIYWKIVVRYILQNPEKAGISLASEYKWSSYKLYNQKQNLVEKDKILDLFQTIDNFYHFISQPDSTECLDIELRPSEKEQKKIETIKKLLNSNSPLIPPNLPIEKIKTKVRILRDAGFSIRTISRITGIMTWIIAAS
ncbi:MAG: transposase [Treponema sp.]|nr:transposase [Treponema sp.]